MFQAVILAVKTKYVQLLNLNLLYCDCNWNITIDLRKLHVKHTLQNTYLANWLVLLIT